MDIKNRNLDKKAQCQASTSEINKWLLLVNENLAIYCKNCNSMFLAYPIQEEDEGKELQKKYTLSGYKTEYVDFPTVLSKFQPCSCHI